MFLSCFEGLWHPVMVVTSPCFISTCAQGCRFQPAGHRPAITQRGPIIPCDHSHNSHETMWRQLRPVRMTDVPSPPPADHLPWRSEIILQPTPVPGTLRLRRYVKFTLVELIRHVNLNQIHMMRFLPICFK